MEKMFEESGMKEEDIPEPISELMHYLHHAHMWEIEKQMREGEHGGDRGELETGGEIYMIPRKMEMMFEASGMKEEDIPEPIAELMHYLHHAHLWDIEKQMREQEQGAVAGRGQRQQPEGDLFMLLNKMMMMFEAAGMSEEDIPEPIQEMMHYLHHAHLWESEKKMREEYGGKGGLQQGGGAQPDLYRQLRQWERQYEGVENIPEDVQDKMHMTHHKHMWNVESNYRRTGQWSKK